MATAVLGGCLHGGAPAGLQQHLRGPARSHLGLPGADAVLLLHPGRHHTRGYPAGNCSSSCMQCTVSRLVINQRGVIMQSCWSVRNKAICADDTNRGPVGSWHGDQACANLPGTELRHEQIVLVVPAPAREEPCRKISAIEWHKFAYHTSHVVFLSRLCACSLCVLKS